MPNTYTKIDSVTVGAGGAASIDFTSIPSTYTDLCVKVSARTNQSVGTTELLISLNGSTSNFSARHLLGSGAAASSGSVARYLGQTQPSTDTANTFSSHDIYLPNYTSTTYAKSYSTDAVTENNGTTAYAVLVAGLWNPATQAAISSLSISASAGSFVQYTTATLYGIKSSAVGAKATGGIITTDGTYFYHTFAASGTFAPTQSITADVLIAAGGGGGGYGQNAGRASGGGGAGGLLYSASQSLTVKNYSITIGAGGTGGFAGGPIPTQGSSSSMTDFTSPTGGGFGGTHGLNNAGNGGSGGGGADNNDPGTGIAGQGNNGVGGSGTGTGGGGGGAGAVGTSPTGGAGATYFGSTYARGGDGGNTTDGNGTNGAANTANGGKGARGVFNGGAGGSGIVIVRYLV